MSDVSSGISSPQSERPSSNQSASGTKPRTPMSRSSSRPGEPAALAAFATRSAAAAPPAGWLASSGLRPAGLRAEPQSTTWASQGRRPRTCRPRASTSPFLSRWGTPPNPRRWSGDRRRERFARRGEHPSPAARRPAAPRGRHARGARAGPGAPSAISVRPDPGRATLSLREKLETPLKVVVVGVVVSLADVAVRQFTAAWPVRPIWIAEGLVVIGVLWALARVLLPSRD